tara:strand:- start:39 stop:434 length:396 start_codon:yes stop_codon:yes gene_type:complete
MLETKNFKESEFRCRCCGVALMKDGYMEKLQLIRDEYGKSMHITSGYRCEAYNDQVSSTGPNGPHTTGRACDVLVSGEDMYRLISLAIKYNMTGIGIKGTGSHLSRFLHMDDLLADSSGFFKRVRPTVWSY